MADIILSNISKKFGDKTLFHNFSLKIESGEFIAIMGESGAGKTTLLNMMGLLEKPDSGTVVLCGQKNPSFSSRAAIDMRRHHISYLFQNYGLIDTETVESNMRIATHFKSISKKKERRLIAGALEQVGLQGYEKRKVYTLSGGEQQSLDEHNRNYVLEILQELNYQGKTIVVVTHDPYVNKCAKRHIMLKGA